MIKRIHGYTPLFTTLWYPALPKQRLNITGIHAASSNKYPKQSRQPRSKFASSSSSKLRKEDFRENRALKYSKLRHVNSSVSHGRLKRKRQAFLESPCINSHSYIFNTNKAFTNNFTSNNVRYFSHSNSKSKPCHNSESNSNFAGISSFVYRFFRNESKFISESLRMDGNASPKVVDLSSLSESIQNELSAQMDDYNRFAILLSHHPLTVPHQILLQFYYSLPKVLPMDRQALLKALVFHNSWDDFWAIVLSENATLTDLEEMIEHVWMWLHANKNLQLGVWLSLSAAHHEASNNNIFSSICDIYEYRFRIPPGKMALFHRLIAVPHDQLSEELSKDSCMSEEDIDLKALMLIRYAQSSSHGNSDSELILQEYGRDSRLHKIPGLDSMVITEFPTTQVIDFLSARRKTLRNERDLFFLLRSARSERHYTLFLSFSHSFRKGFMTSDFLINYFVMQTHLLSEKVFLSIVKSHFRALTIETLDMILLSLLKTEDGRKILGTISRRHNETFTSLVDKAIHKKHNAEVLLSLLELSSTKGRSTLRKALPTFGAQQDYFSKLLDCKFTEYNFTELWRYGIREQFLNDSNTGKLFQKTLSKSWNVKRLVKRSQKFNSSSARSNFREQFRYATISEKRRMFVRLQAMAQALSIAEASQIAEVLNILKKYLHEGKEFVLFEDKFGKTYIFNHFIKFTMKFIYQVDGSGKGITKMRAVLKGLHFDSTVMQASIFQFMTVHKPEISLEILENYKHKPSFLNSTIMSGIEQGILTSPKLEKENRLRLFQSLQKAKARLGFSTKITPASMTLMGNLVFDVSNRDDVSNELKGFIRVAYRRGVPAKVIRSWTKKL